MRPRVRGRYSTPSWTTGQRSGRCRSIRPGPGDPRRQTFSSSGTEGNGGGRDRGATPGPRRWKDERRADRARAWQTAHERDGTLALRSSVLNLIVVTDE